MTQAPIASTTIQSWFRIGHQHPALPGHFPGSPVVPGVVLLDQVIAALIVAGMSADANTEWPQVKFQSPLLPGQLAALALNITDQQARFEITRGDERIALGNLRWSRA